MTILIQKVRKDTSRPWSITVGRLWPQKRSHLPPSTSQLTELIPSSPTWWKGRFPLHIGSAAVTLEIGTCWQLVPFFLALLWAASKLMSQVLGMIKSMQGTGPAPWCLHLTSCGTVALLTIQALGHSTWWIYSFQLATKISNRKQTKILPCKEER